MSKFTIVLTLILVFSCGAVATIAPARYKVTIETDSQTYTYTDVVHYAWEGGVLVLTRTEGQVDRHEVKRSRVEVERL